MRATKTQVLDKKFSHHTFSKSKSKIPMERASIIDFCLVLLPTLTNLAAFVLFTYSGIYKGNTKPHELPILRLLQDNPSLTTPVFGFFLLRPFLQSIAHSPDSCDARLIFILIGMFLVDTIEYFRHRLSHNVKFLYVGDGHKVHHSTKPGTLTITH